MLRCLHNVFKKAPQSIEAEKPKQAPNFKTLVPPDFEVDTEPSGSSTSTEATSSRSPSSKLLLRSKKREQLKEQPLPPVVSEVTTLLCEAESRATSEDFAKSVELLEKATTLGSACAAAKLGLVYHGGNSAINPDYASASAYYFLALKLIYMIPSNKWDISLLLDVIAGISEIYRKQMSRKRDRDIWNTGVRAVKHIESVLKDPTVTKFYEHKDFQKCKAIRIHINYCLGMTAEADEDYTEAIKFYETCYRVGDCNFATADKLIKKSQEKAKMLQKQIPKVKPVCVSCDFEPKELKDIWKLLVCSKCQVAAACSRKCLADHLATHKS